MQLVAGPADVITVLALGQTLAEGVPDSVLRDPRVASPTSAAPPS